MAFEYRGSDHPLNYRDEMAAGNKPRVSLRQVTSRPDARTSTYDRIAEQRTTPIQSEFAGTGSLRTSPQERLASLHQAGFVPTRRQQAQGLARDKVSADTDLVRAQTEQSRAEVLGLRAGGRTVPASSVPGFDRFGVRDVAGGEEEQNYFSERV